MDNCVEHIRGNNCTCSILLDEPLESCRVHGSGEWPPQCDVCGQFTKYKEIKMSLINSSKIKKQVRDAGFRISKEAFPQFERKVSLAISEAIAAVTADQRKTILPTDVA